MKIKVFDLNVFNSDRVVLKKSENLLCFPHTL